MTLTSGIAYTTTSLHQLLLSYPPRPTASCSRTSSRVVSTVMYRGGLRIPAASLRTSVSYSTVRSSLCHLKRSTSPRSRHFSTPAQSPEDKKAVSTDDKPLPSPQSSPKEDASVFNTEPIILTTQPPLASPSLPNQAEPGANSSANTAAADQLNALKERMQEMTTEALKQMRIRGDEFTTRVAKTFSKLGAELNRVTGYEEIEVLKRKVVEQGAHTVVCDTRLPPSHANIPPCVGPISYQSPIYSKRGRRHALPRRRTRPPYCSARNRSGR